MDLRELKPIANGRVGRRVVEVVGDRGTRDEDLGTVTHTTRSTYYKGRRRDMKKDRWKTLERATHIHRHCFLLFLDPFL